MQEDLFRNRYLSTIIKKQTNNRILDPYHLSTSGLRPSK